MYSTRTFPASPKLLATLPKMAQDTSSGEYDFLFEYVLQFLKSPLWTTPLQSFIDEYCLVFDGAEENAFNQTEIHDVRTTKNS